MYSKKLYYTKPHTLILYSFPVLTKLNILVYSWVSVVFFISIANKLCEFFLYDSLVNTLNSYFLH